MRLEVSNSVLCSTLGQYQVVQGLALCSFRCLQGGAAQPFWISGPGLHWAQSKYFLFVSSANFPCWMLIPPPLRGAWLCLLCTPTRAVQPDMHPKPSFLWSGQTQLPQHLLECIPHTPEHCCGLCAALSRTLGMAAWPSSKLASLPKLVDPREIS